MQKKGRVNHINKFTNHKVKYGTVDVNDNKSIYLNISTWIKPKQIEVNPDTLVKKLNKDVRQCIHTYLSKVGSNQKYIIDTDLRSSGIKNTKKSFMSSDITFFTKKPFNEIGDDITELCSFLIKQLEQKYIKELEFSKRK
jgi:hypothetical protein